MGRDENKIGERSPGIQLDADSLSMIDLDCTYL
jgi:hypothetical protein